MLICFDIFARVLIKFIVKLMKLQNLRARIIISGLDNQGASSVYEEAIYEQLKACNVV